jgi:membrane-bound serine protease (ClpP class)
MPDWLGIVLLYVVGTAVLVAEVFVPSHGVLSLVAFATLGFAVYETFQISGLWGLVSLSALVVLIPASVLVMVKTWHRTPIGKRICPPNPQLGEKDRMPLETLRAVIGQRGRALTLLRPVGTCEFQGQRLECKSEQGVIQKGAEVEAIGLADRTLVVRPVQTHDVVKA